MASRTSSGVGCSRNWRTRPVACSSASRLGVYAGADSPMTSPATTGSTPLASSASHRASPMAKYTERRRIVRATTSSSANTTTASTNGSPLIGSL